MKIEILENTSLAISPREVRSFKQGDIVDELDTLSLERRERLVELKVAKEVAKREKKVVEPVKENKMVKPAKETKSKKGK